MKVIPEDMVDNPPSIVVISGGQPYRKGYIEIHIQKPITHHTWEQGRFTTYLITVETNNRAFSLTKSCVRRRYSEFVWLRSKLADHFQDVTPPSLPSKKFFGRKFIPQVIEERMIGLQEFLEKVTDRQIYLSDSVLHLFLQTPLSTEEILDCVEGRSQKGVLETIMEFSNFGCRGRKETDNTSGYDSNSSICTTSSHDSVGLAESVPKATELTSPISTTDTDDNKPQTLAPRCLPKTMSTPNFFHTHGTHPEFYIARRVNMDNQSSSGSLPHSMSNSDISSYNSEPSGNDRRKNGRKQRRVTFSPEVTVAEVIDRFSRSPRMVRLSEIPSKIIESTMAY